jgi:hypothetical protein
MLRMSLRLSLWLLAIGLLFLVSRADSRSTPRRDQGARPSVRRALNMPPDWTWPPSPEMLAEGDRCKARLTELGVVFDPGRATRKVATPVVLRTMELGAVKLVPLAGRPPFVMDCHLAETLASAASPALRDLGVRELRFTSVHTYRTVKGRRFLSRHAIGLAIDIFELVSDDGTVRRVSRDYWARDRFLRRVEERLRQSGFFRGPLTPGNDRRGHHDHFHLEARTPGERRAPLPTS